MAELLSQINNICRKNCKYIKNRKDQDDNMHDCLTCNFSSICIHGCNYYIHHAGKRNNSKTDVCIYHEENKCKCNIRDHILEMKQED